jgi:4'-phosphopantetheinyl transferase
LNPLDIEIVAEKGKKPFIRYPGTQLQFNISHSGQWVVVALAYEELGIDIEQINSSFDYSMLLEDHFTVAEQRFVIDAEIPATAFYFLWTRKEALVKAAGGGLQEKLKAVSVLDGQDFAEVNKKKWKISSFTLSADYPVSLAYCGSLKNCYFDGSLLISPQVQSK